MVCAFRGWNDGGEAASTAVAYLRDRLGATRFASIDPEEFLDFQVHRPQVRVVDGVTRHIEWPVHEFLAARAGGRDLVLMLGVEPNMRWRTFTEHVVEVARATGVELLVTLGAFLADVPHTLHPPVTGAARDSEQAARIGLVPSRYEGPTGIVGVLHDAATRAGLPSVSLWAGVPHYLPGGPNPKAALALLQKLGTLVRIDIPADTLERAATAWSAQIDSAVAANEDLSGHVRRLEEAAGEREDLGPAPSGDALAAEIERFLRDRPDDAT
jgi:proteasome assembly chaperone (PAC2) family protein